MQYVGRVAVNDSLAPLMQVIDSVTMQQLPGFPLTVGTGVSQAVQLDTDSVYFAHDGTPGTITMTNIITGISATLTSPDAWSGVYCLEIDHAGGRLVACDNLSGNLYLIDLVHFTILTKIAGQHAGFAVGNRLYTVSGNVLNIYSITNPASPVLLNSLTANQAAVYDHIKIDTAHGLLYADWGDVNGCGIDVLTYAGDHLSLQTVIPGWQQSGPARSTFCPGVDLAISPDGKLLALGSEGGTGGPGGLIVWDVSMIAAGGTEATIHQVCYCNAETRAAVRDSKDYVYSVCRYSYEVHGPDGTLLFSGSVGSILGDQMQPFSADPTLFIVPSNGSQSLLFQCQNGTMTPLVDYGDSTIFDTWWDGQHLIALVNAYGWLSIIVYSIGPGPAYALTQIDSWGGVGNGIFGPVQSPGLALDGVYGQPGAVLWVADGGIGIHAFDFSTPGQLAEITRGNLPDPLAVFPAAPTIAAAQVANGQVETPFSYAIMGAFYDAYGICCGLTPLSNTISLSAPDNAIQVTLTATPPILATTLTLYGKFTYPSGVSFNPGTITGAVGLPANTTSFLVITPHVAWFGGPPNLQQGNLIPSAGLIVTIRFSGERTYITQGDLGIRVYHRTTMLRTSQITATGDPTPSNNPLGCGGFDLYLDADGNPYLGILNYTESGSHGGFVGLALASNPDTPPATFMPTPAGGFTTRSSGRTAVAATLAGAVGFVSY